MAIPNYLAKIKSSGVYRYVFDKSEIPVSERSSLRLVVGYSERGPFNTPVYISDAAEFIQTFGNISRRLERKGIFFHRLAIQALEAGPILALNLKPFDEEKTSMMTFNASDIVVNEDGQKYDPSLVRTDAPVVQPVAQSGAADTPIIAVYDSNRFWKITDNLMNIGRSTTEPADLRDCDYIRIVQTSSAEDSVTLFIRPVVPTSYNVKISDWYSSEVSEEMPSYMEAIQDHMLSEFFAEIYVFRGNLKNPGLYTEDGTMGTFIVNDNGDSTFQAFCKIENGELKTNSNFKDAFGEPADALAAMSSVTTSNFIGRYQGILFPSFRDASGSFISLDSVFNADYSAHKCLMTLNENALDAIYDADTDGNGSYGDGEVAPGDYDVAGMVHALASLVHAPTTGNSYNVKTPAVNAPISGYYLKGYEYKYITKTDKDADLQKKIFKTLDYKGIQQALTNNVDCDYKYLIDTFQTYPGSIMKAKFAAILKEKFNCLGILNFPPIADCAIKIGYPGVTGGFNMADVTKSSSGISLPSESQGASWCAYYTQLQMTDGTNKFVVPSAALVSNLFMQKRSVRHPYSIVAGPNFGRIDYPGVIGPDYNYARPDLDALEPFGVNAIIYIPRKGVIINSNQTAKQTPVSALSKVHIRELVTYLQDTIEDMLYGYQWEFNTPELRAAVEAKLNTILGLVQANGGIYEFRAQCDDKNNTAETIDNEMLICDVEIEPGRGCGKLVQTLTIHRTGGIASSPRN